MTRIAILVALCLFTACNNRPQLNLERPSPTYDIVEREITIDGKLKDWEGVKANVVAGRDHLWFGQDMTPEKWHGDADHSNSWRAAWHGNKLYFLFEVTDDAVIDPPGQPNSFLNDCIEILIDPKGEGGLRTVEENGVKRLRGYEMHFLPTGKTEVFVNDVLSPLYPMENPQTERFESKWQGQRTAFKTKSGYVMEIAFSIPDVELKRGMSFGLDTDTCDDDGEGRKSLQIWSGKQVDFWLTMDHYGRVTLK